MDSNSFEINVKHLSEKTYKISVNPTTTVSEVKQQLADLSQNTPDKLKLIFKGRIWKTDSDTMADLKVEPNVTLHMIVNKAQPTTTPEPTPQQNTQNNPFSNPNPNQNQQNQGFNNANPFGGMGMPGMGMGMPGMGMQGMQGMQGMNPQMMQQMMQNPQARAMAQQLLSNPDALRNMINNNPMLSQMAQNNPQLQHALNDPGMLQMMQNMFSGPPPNMPGQPNQQTQPNPQGQTNTQNQPGQQGQQGNTQAPPPMPDLSAFMNNPQMQQNMFGQGTFQQPQQQSQNPEEEYKDQLKKLEEMGFTNKDLNIQVLKQCYGNVDAAVEKLLSMF